MSLTVAKDEGVTVITITSNPNNKWPILCQILGSLCHSPVCTVSQHVKAKMTEICTALGIVQIIVGVLNILTGILILRYGIYSIVMSDAPFWLGGVFLVVGIVSIVAAWFPSSSLLRITDELNKLSAVLAVIDLLLYLLYLCDLMSAAMSYKLDVVQPLLKQFPPAARDTQEEQMIHEALVVTMIIFSALQLCVTISFSILTMKELFKRNSMEDPQLYKPLREVTVSHICLTEHKK